MLATKALLIPRSDQDDMVNIFIKFQDENVYFVYRKDLVICGLFIQ